MAVRRRLRFSGVAWWSDSRFAPSNAGVLYAGLSCTAALPLPTSGLAPAGCFPTTSPSGGNFVVADAAAGLGVLYQTLNGLTVGQDYVVSFYQAAGQQKTYLGDTQEEWSVTMGGALTTGSVTLLDGSTVPGVTIITGGETHTSSLMQNRNGDFTDWNYQSLFFNATSSSELLEFLAVGGPRGVPPFILLDGVSVSEAPEPTTYLLLGVGLLGLVAIRRRMTTVKQ